MDRLLLFLLAFSLGFLAAIPVGGSQIEAAKRAIHGHLLSAWLVVLGSVSSDLMYGSVALFGIAPFLRIPAVMASFNAAGAVILWALAFVTIKESKKPHHVQLAQASLTSAGRAYVTGFTLAASNPPMILSWLYGVTLAQHLGLANPLTPGRKILFIAGGVLGLGAYLSTLTVVIHRLKHFIPLKALARVYYWLGIVLFLLAFFFVYNALRYFLRMS